LAWIGKTLEQVRDVLARDIDEAAPQPGKLSASH
jgi:hypothetical protein